VAQEFWQCGGNLAAVVRPPEIAKF